MEGRGVTALTQIRKKKTTEGEGAALGRELHLYLTTVFVWIFWTQLQETEESPEHDLALRALKTQETRAEGGKKGRRFRSDIRIRFFPQRVAGH